MPYTYSQATVPHFDGPPAGKTIRFPPDNPLQYDTLFTPNNVTTTAYITLNLPSTTVGSRVTIDTISMFVPIQYATTIAPANIQPKGWYFTLTLMDSNGKLLDVFQSDVDIMLPVSPNSQVGYAVIQALRNYSTPILLQSTDTVQLLWSIAYAYSPGAQINLIHTQVQPIDVIQLRGTVYGEKEKIA